MFLYRVIRAFKKHRVPHAIVGGYAVALHGAVRGTVDVDLVIPFVAEQFSAAETALKSIGLESRLPVTAKEVFAYREEYMKNRNLLAWNFYNSLKPSETVDIVLTEDLSKLKTVNIKSGGLDLPVVEIKDLIRMKERSGRPQDLEDVKALKEIQK